MAKACSKVYQLKDMQEDREIRRNTRWNKGTWVVQIVRMVSVIMAVSSSIG